MKYLSSLILFLASAGVAAAAIITPTTVSDTGTFDASGASETSLGALIDGSGLSGTPVDDGTNAGGVTHVGGNGDLDEKWVTKSNNYGGDFFAGLSDTVQLDFSLDSAYDITTAYVWGYYYYGNGNSATSIDVTYSTDGSSFSGSETIELTIPPDSLNPASVNAPALNNAPAGTTDVRFLITDNGYGIGAGGDRVGLGEVAFGTIPEPASFSLLGIFGLLYLLHRKLNG